MSGCRWPHKHDLGGLSRPDHERFHAISMRFSGQKCLKTRMDIA
jgi:hypothetical protein